ncbi:hypothetical protein [Bacillus sp. FJAT-27245]|uniref:hypothetical protein n=1 Tax=Bacillus sp. FJAT-27245 TaxID=1684144 RepID=UPI0006A7F190|nr:hypothetical protein [Bacillus sp. FJAT-27245]
MKKLFFSLCMMVLFLNLVPFHTGAAVAFTYSQAVQSVQQAEKAAALLKQETSYDYRVKAYPSNPVSLPKMEYYNDARAKLQLARDRVRTLPPQKRNELEARLNSTVSLPIARAQAYIDAINQGTKTLALTEDFNKKYLAGPTEKNTEAAFHLLSKEINKQAILLYRVYGKTTRDAILAKYKAPGEKLLNETRPFISLKMEVDSFISIYFTADGELVKTRLESLERKIWDFKDRPFRVKLARYLDDSFVWVPGNTIKKPIADPNRPFVYGFDNQKNVIRYNYKTKEKKVLKLDLKTEKMMVSGDVLYVLLMTREEHDPYWSHNQSGAVAVIDTKTFTLIKEFPINIDPYDIAVDDSYIYLTPGSGQSTHVYRYSRKTYEFLGSEYVVDFTDQSTIKFSEALNKFYTVRAKGLIKKMSGFQYTDNFSRVNHFRSPYHGDYPLTPLFYLSPDGKYLFNGSGNVFLTTNDKATDMTFFKRITGGSPNAFYSLGFNLEDGKFYTGGTIVSVYDYRTLELKEIYSTKMWHHYVFYHNHLLTTIGEKYMDDENKVLKASISHYRTDDEGSPLIPLLPTSNYYEFFQ